MSGDDVIINNTSLNNPVVGSTTCTPCNASSVTLSGNKQLVIGSGTLSVSGSISAPSGTNVLVNTAGGTLTFNTLTVDNSTGLTLSGGNIAGTLASTNPATLVNGTGGTATSYDAATGGTLTIGANVTMDQIHDVNMGNGENLSIGDHTYILDGASINVPGPTTSAISLGGGTAGTFRHVGSTGGVVQPPVNMDSSGNAAIEDGSSGGSGLDLFSPQNKGSMLAGLLRTTTSVANITLDSGGGSANTYTLANDMTADDTAGGAITLKGAGGSLNLNSHTLSIKGDFQWDATSTAPAGASVMGPGTFGPSGGAPSDLTVLAGGATGGTFSGTGVTIAAGTTMAINGNIMQLPDNFTLDVGGTLDLAGTNVTTASSPNVGTQLTIESSGRLLHTGSNVATFGANGPVVNSHGVIEDGSGSGGMLSLQQGTSVTNQLSGTLQTDDANALIQLGGAVHHLQGALTSDTSRGGSVATSASNGTPDLQISGQTLTLIGSSLDHNAGTISTNSPATIAGPGTLSLGGGNFGVGGPLTITAPVNQTAATDVGGFGGELDIGGTWTSQANITDTSNAFTLMKVLSGGVLRYSGTGSSTVSHPLTIDGLVDDADPPPSAVWLLDATNGGMNPSGATTVDPSGTLSVSTSTAHLKVMNGVSNFSGSTLSGGSYVAAGLLQAVTGPVTTLDANLSLSGSGKLTRDDAPANDSALTGLTTIPSGRNLTLTGQTLTTGNPLTVDGTLAGDGSVSGSVINNGTVSPGHSPGTLTVNGDYTQGSGGALNIKVDGTGAGQFDVLNVTGNVNLNGTLNLLPSAGYAASAAPGDTQAFLPYGGTRTGTFATTTVSPVLAAGKPFTATYDDANHRVLSSVGQPPPPPPTPATVVTPTPTVTPPPPQPSTPPPPTLVVEKAKAKKNGVIALTLFAPEPGTFNALATVHVVNGRVLASKLVTYGTASATTTHAGPVNFAVQPTAAGKRLLKTHKSIPVAVHLSFRSSAHLGTTASSKDLRVKVKGKKKH